MREEGMEARLAEAGGVGGAGGAEGEEAAQQGNDVTTDVDYADALAAPLNRSGRHTTSLAPDPRSPILPTMAGLWQLTLSWQPSEHQQAQLQQLYALTLAGNRQFNLTRITEPEEFWEKHLWDSLRGVGQFLQGEGESGVGSRESGVGVSFDVSAQPNSAQSNEGRRQAVEGKLQDEHLVEWDQEPALLHTSHLTSHTSHLNVIDIGTGAGFPGLPVAIAQPNWAVTLLDATRKKITFLDQVLANLGLANTTTLVERVETVGRQKHQRQTYDLALIRAVAAATVCAEYALPLLKIGGYAVLYRGQWTEAETASLETAIAVLGGKIDSIEAFTTPLTHSDRHCIYLKKIAPTPNEFPRAIGIPVQKPLGSSSNNGA